MVLIGILLREENEKLYVKREIFDIVLKTGGIPMGIYIKDYEKYLDICDGFIMPGGDDYLTDELLMISKIYDLNKPLLGICLGMQTIGIWKDAHMIDVNSHKSLDKYVHKININENSLLYKILGKKEILVNSRHKNTIINTNLKIGAYDDNGVIEEIEDDKHKFFMGLQWHPESLIDDENSIKLFKFFIGRCKY